MKIKTMTTTSSRPEKRELLSRSEEGFFGLGRDFCVRTSL
jgi:hypothetical protein